ncbi:MobC family replication-relaxation protein [Vibrio sp. WXL103]|uniref:MobC family replication-relaxation protein n=1 Tax=unclassified Vibrio TaxID=2614977 RepID=UPI003EC68E51
MSHLIADPRERERINTEKMAKVIHFLKQEVYSDIKNLTLLLGVKSRRPVDRLLNKLIDLGFVRKHVYDFPTGQFSVWGITDLGLTQYVKDTNEDFVSFEPYRVKFTNLNHKLMNQLIYLHLTKRNWTNWLNSDRYAFRQQYDLEHRPDALMTTPTGHVVAFETERSLKAVRRYRSIMKSHIIAKQKKYWSVVVYVVPDENIKKLLTNRFNKIEYIQFDESKYPFEHYQSKLIRIYTIDELKNLTIG